MRSLKALTYGDLLYEHWPKIASKITNYYYLSIKITEEMLNLQLAGKAGEGRSEPGISLDFRGLTRQRRNRAASSGDTVKSKPP
jgi:hypothetical protein